VAKGVEDNRVVALAGLLNWLHPHGWTLNLHCKVQFLPGSKVCLFDSALRRGASGVGKLNRQKVQTSLLGKSMGLFRTAGWGP